MSDKKELDIGISKFAREKVIEHLKYSFTQDHIDEGEFEKRCKVALNTKNRMDLKVIVEDLPEYVEEQKNQQDTAPAVIINKGKVKAQGTIVSILGGVERKGLWKPPQKLNMFVTMGAVDLDFRKAEFPPGVTEINLFCVMGGIDIKIPPGVNIENHCIAILGGVDDKSEYSEAPHNPTLKITGIVVMGSLEIKTPKEGLMQRILKKLGL